jgi:hypothetical protein
VEAEGAVIQLVTRCSSEEEFIERFARFATETDIVVPAVPDVSVGNERHFAIRLQDGSMVMKGRCEVSEVRPGVAAPGAAPRPSGPALMRLRLREMDAHSCGIHLRLMERHACSTAGGEPRPDAPVTPPRPASTTTDVSAVTVVGDASPQPDEETTAISQLPRPETRVLGAAFTLPANPLSDLDAAELASFVELTLLESRAQADVEPTLLVGPPAPATRSAARLVAARQIARRAAPYASCVFVGLLFGLAIGSGSKPVRVAGAPGLAPPPVTRPPLTGSAPENDPPISSPDVVDTQRPLPPAATLVVTSFPPRALIKLNKRRMGRTPREISTTRFERVRIEASLPGYKPWKKTLYLEEAESKVDVTLVRIHRTNARRATPPAATAPPSRATPTTPVAGTAAVAAR